MIPANISRNHIIQAIRETSERRIPLSRQSRNYLLRYEDKLLPPKYVISIANRYANGYELDPQLFGGGVESNSFLASRGFEIVRRIKLTESAGRITRPQATSEEPQLTQKHNERCPACKKTIKKLLERVYGEVRERYSLSCGSTPDAFKGTRYYDSLLGIYQSLRILRGNTEFVRTEILPPVDYYIPSAKLIVEFDESQHFTACRKLTLSRYPMDFSMGFSKDKWIRLCDQINQTDNEPVYRDEQRAWYDTLRDFAPSKLGLRPTIRIFASDFAWCSLNYNEDADVRKFKEILERKEHDWNIELRTDPEPFVARIIIGGDWYGNPEVVNNLLRKVCEIWPEGKRVKSLITCGGFVKFKWPNYLSKYNIGNNLEPSDKVLSELTTEARNSVDRVLGNGVYEELAKVTDYITIGIDSYKDKISTTQNYIGQLHVELVLLLDLKTGYFHWTGKSYPTPSQQNGLVRICDLDTHFLELRDVGVTMILGCHDLTMFNNRNWHNTGQWRKEIKATFRELAKRHQPVLVLQHPHTTDSIWTWASAWNELAGELPSVQRYASAGRYWNSKVERSDLYDVLEYTKLGNTVDFVVWIPRL